MSRDPKTQPPSPNFFFMSLGFSLIIWVGSRYIRGPEYYMLLGWVLFSEAFVYLVRSTTEDPREIIKARLFFWALAFLFLGPWAWGTYAG